MAPSSIINDVGSGGRNRGFKVQWLSKPLVCISIQEKVQYSVPGKSRYYLRPPYHSFGKRKSKMRLISNLYVNK